MSFPWSNPVSEKKKHLKYTHAEFCEAYEKARQYMILSRNTCCSKEVCAKYSKRCRKEHLVDGVYPQLAADCRSTDIAFGHLMWGVKNGRYTNHWKVMYCIKAKKKNIGMTMHEYMVEVEREYEVIETFTRSGRIKRQRSP